MKRDRLLNFLNKYLNSHKISDYSVNGLQVEGKDEIKNILLGVSYSVELGKKAQKENFDAIIVHHGILWNKPQKITGNFKKRIEVLIKNDINLIAYHLPLDLHPVIGNNITILKLFGIKKIEKFGYYDGIYLGFCGRLKKKTDINEIERIIKAKINPESIFINSGKKEIKTIGVISGGGSNFIEEAYYKNIDLFITGEGKENVYELAREYKINFVACGHYRTEVFGVKELGKLISKKFGIKTEFFDTFNPF